jgi:hypothetical protein
MTERVTLKPRVYIYSSVICYASDIKYIRNI